jgi:hypothetical protein
VSNEPDIVYALRIPRKVFERVRKWADSQQPKISVAAVVRYVLECGIAELEKRK